MDRSSFPREREEALLRRILCVVRIARDAQARSVDEIRVPLDKLCEGVWVLRRRILLEKSVVSHQGLNFSFGLWAEVAFPYQYRV